MTALGKHHASSAANQDRVTANCHQLSSWFDTAFRFICNTNIMIDDSVVKRVCMHQQ